MKALSHRFASTITWGVHLSFLSTDLIECFGALGYHWVFLDAQRTKLSHSNCSELVRAADAAGMFCVVRTSRIDGPVIEAFLDAGVLGILAPDIATPAQARALVAAVKFPPQGNRRNGHGSTHTPTEYFVEANRDTFIAALIESQSGLDELTAIAAVPGIDYVSIGPNDLAASLGIAAGVSSPEVRAKVAEARACLTALGKPQIAVVSDIEQAQHAAVTGAQLIAVSDAALIGTAGRSFLDAAMRVRYSLSSLTREG
jgi:4-hydroxy-2-oxoheptanedioate aldolase